MFRNHTLAALQGADLAELRPHLHERLVERGEVLTAQGAEVERIFFPTTAYLANMVTFSDGRSAETFVMGAEGVSGLAAFLARQPCAWSVEVKAPGAVYQLPAGIFRARVEQSQPLRDHLLRLTYDYQAQAAFGVGCGSLHDLTSRLARFILTGCDRLGGDTLRLTQQDIAGLLGAQRTTTNSAANQLKAARAIRYSRGVIRSWTGKP
jgi:CRP-like cAMP-binding protein